MAREIKVAIIGDASQLNQALSLSSSSMSNWGIAAGAAAATAVAAIGAAAVGIGAALYNVGADFDSAYDQIRVGTGATGEEFAALQDTVRAIATDTPSSLGDIGTAVTALNARLGLAGPELEAMAESFLNLSRITGTDLTTNIANITRVFGDWSITDHADAMDKLFRTTQNTGIGLDQLSTIVVQFGAPMRALGFSFEDAIALIGKFEAEGVNLETVMAGMKMGLKNMAKAGEDPIATFKRVTDEIKNASTESEATGIAFELFGQRAGIDMARAIREGRFEIDDLVTAISTGSDTITQADQDTRDFSEAWDIFYNNVLLKLEPVATTVFEGIAGAMERAAPIAEDLVTKLEPVATALGQLATDLQSGWDENGLLGALEAVGTWFDENADRAKNWLDSTGDAWQDWFDSEGIGLADTLNTWVKEELEPRLADAFYDIGQDLGPNVTGGFADWVTSEWGNPEYWLTLATAGTHDSILRLSEWITDQFMNIGRQIVDGLIAGVAAVWGGIWNWFRGGFEGVLQNLRQLLGIHSPSTVFAEIGRDIVLGLLMGLSQFAGMVASFFSVLANGIINVFAGAGSWLIEAGQRLVKGLLVGFSSGIGGFQNLISGITGGIVGALPGFAQGGFVGGPMGAPQLAVVHGGEQVLTPAQQQQGGRGGPIMVKNYVMLDRELVGRNMDDRSYKRSRATYGKRGR